MAWGKKTNRPITKIKDSQKRSSKMTISQIEPNTNNGTFQKPLFRWANGENLMLISYESYAMKEQHWPYSFTVSEKAWIDQTDTLYVYYCLFDCFILWLNYDGKSVRILHWFNFYILTNYPWTCNNDRFLTLV